jgi:hypothetical protein
MKLRDFEQMQLVQERKLPTEANLDDLSPVMLRVYQDGRGKYEVDPKNGRFRRQQGEDVGPWEKLEK